MKRKLKPFSVDNPLSYYTDEKNIPNQELVQQTIEYFETGAGKRAFKPLEFLNLLWKQQTLIKANIKDTESLFSALCAIPLTGLERHILYGFIIKWAGGYPLEAPLRLENSELYYQFRKRLLVDFLNYEGETPEKEFCKADFNRRKEHQKIAIALTTAINNNVNVVEILKGMAEPGQQIEVYRSFDKLFAAVAESSLGKMQSQQHYLMELSKHNFQFNVWLQENKNWEYGNKAQYQQFLNKKTFQEYLDFVGNKTLPEIYFQKVAEEAEIYINLFRKQYEVSENKERLLQTEIDNYEKLFFC